MMQTCSYISVTKSFKVCLMLTFAVALHWDNQCDFKFLSQCKPTVLSQTLSHKHRRHNELYISCKYEKLETLSFDSSLSLLQLRKCISSFTSNLTSSGVIESVSLSFAATQLNTRASVSQCEIHARGFNILPHKMKKQPQCASLVANFVFL